ncbi:response regulator transcription factor [Rhodococcus sp. ARC_M12]|uniref:response regulator transcription factor n=1 Tax=unclassified Rhodococcus (in: high G+C Gram-positive bacteria) TaxID=192944 RepID=UPI001FB256B8|nr:MULTISPECIES: response regulator transcription factor [unclassified Rhodococcus (in: high G+C Gram-positive bacteria)]MCJ0893187.1 response regulator transcription factor [Rhodococcus sp. ARC_M5]MCJ0976544.1 response regulator transcription factor [Rhodococcus sp. ARC_M12]
MVNILFVEDDPAVAEAMTLGLNRLGHRVDHRPDGNGDLDNALTSAEIVLLDLGLPGADGYEICRRIRAQSSIPIIILTARSDDIDTVAGLEAGADDYVVKPASPRVLDARIKAVVRRSTDTTTAAATAAAIVEQYRDVTVDRSSLQVRKGGALLTLTPTELRLLLALTENVGHVLSRGQLLSAAWDQDYLGDSRIVDAAIQRLRGKIEDDPAAPATIETVRGFGYRFDPGPVR